MLHFNTNRRWVKKYFPQYLKDLNKIFIKMNIVTVMDSNIQI